MTMPSVERKAQEIRRKAREVHELADSLSLHMDPWFAAGAQVPMRKAAELLEDAMDALNTGDEDLR